MRNTPLKQELIMNGISVSQPQENTLHKKPQTGITGALSQHPTPKPIRKIVLYTSQHQRHEFPLLNDNQVGIKKGYQDIVIESYNDDDRKTTSTQLDKGKYQTISDLYASFMNDSSTNTQSTQLI